MDIITPLTQYAESHAGGVMRNDTDVTGNAPRVLPSFLKEFADFTDPSNAEKEASDEVLKSADSDADIISEILVKMTGITAAVSEEPAVVQPDIIFAEAKPASIEVVEDQITNFANLDVESHGVDNEADHVVIEAPVKSDSGERLPETAPENILMNAENKNIVVSQSAISALTLLPDRTPELMRDSANPDLDTFAPTSTEEKPATEVVRNTAFAEFGHKPSAMVEGKSITASQSAIPGSPSLPDKTPKSLRDSVSPESSTFDLISAEEKPMAEVMRNTALAESGHKLSTMIEHRGGPQGIALPESLGDLAQSRAQPETRQLQINPPVMLRQITDTVVTMRDEMVEIRLSPEELGRVRMVLTGQDRAPHLTIWIDRPEVLEQMRRQGDTLLQQLRDQGMSGASLDFRDGRQTHSDENPDQRFVSSHNNKGEGSSLLAAEPSKVLRTPLLSGMHGIDIRV